MSEDFDRESAEKLLILLKEQDERKRYNWISTIFPDEGEVLEGCLKPTSRENYKKHIEFINAGENYIERAFIAGNRCGKTLTGLYELVTHCTGRYPKWWKGKKFNRAVQCWLVGDRGDTIRDGMQRDLVGKDGFGTGLIPKDLFVGQPTALQGTPLGYGIYSIRHITGGVSNIIVKTYNAGKNAFEGAAIDVAMLDEECPLDIYVEVQMRTLTTGGTVYNTFTPDSGLTPTVLHFLDKPGVGEFPRFVTMVGWDDVPHLSEEKKRQLLSTIPVHMRDVKTKGIPYAGVGAIWPIPEADITVQPFKIPAFWPKAYSFDPGWSKTAALWGAYDEEADTWYIYDEYYRGQAEPEVHSAGIRARGAWIEGVVDPHGSKNGRGVNSESFLEAYERYGLNLTLSSPSGPGSVELRVTEVYSRLSTGRLKICSNLVNFFYEYRMYHRNDKGEIVKKNNHLMDCIGYLMLCGLSVAKTFEDEEQYNRPSQNYQESTRNSITGY
jgi:phage terminase large subunit-like protein